MLDTLITDRLLEEFQELIDKILEVDPDFFSKLSTQTENDSVSVLLKIKELLDSRSLK